MGQTVSISRTSLPKPDDQELCNKFQWGDLIEANVYNVKIPDNLIWHNLSHRGDLVDIYILDAEGNAIAHVWGKTSSYDFRVFMAKSTEKFDLTKGQVIKGHFVTHESLYQEKKLVYELFCRQRNGIHDQQKVCDEKYESLISFIDEHKLDVTKPERIVLDAENEVEGMFKSLI